MPPVSLPPATPTPGSLIAQRFTIRRLAGRGGMGSVFLAHDEHTGLPVALKLIHAPGNSEATQRFAREARLLASLRHPGIVSFVSHGLTEEGQPFLAMEWLEGGDLARRLAQAPLSLSESLQLFRRASDALAAAHAQGIIHRDLKPSNLVLRADKPGDVVLLDFGLAHIHATSQQLTGSGAMLGSPGYMAPEQASSLRDLTPSADIFSLGCVFYECLTGLPPFRAPHLAAVLAKILFSEPTPLSTLRPDLPAPLQALVGRMLAKDPRQRPQNAEELASALKALELPGDLPPPTRTSSASVPTSPAHAEQQLVSVLLATSRISARDAPTLDLEEHAKDQQHLQMVLQNLQAHSAHAALLADGSLVATFALERGTAIDQAALAAHCALLAKERWPDSIVALTTGLSLRGYPLPAGDAVDRAGKLLQLEKNGHLVSSAQVLVDDATAGLLGSRFQLEKKISDIFLLSGERLSVDESRPLLGRPTSCVGREQELMLLELAFTNCVEDCSARVLLVTAPAGAGKSRLRHELLRRLERHAQPPLAVLGRADPMNTTAALGLVGQAVRRVCDVVDGEPLEARRAKLVQRLTRHLSPAQHKEVTEFLGELCAIPFPVENSPRLRAAREDPQLMSAQVTQALVTWLKAECAQRPVLLMLEDLHWSDGPSIHLMDQVLRELSEQPLMVLALARPEVKELFPGLWARSVQEIPLRGLRPKASTQLVREVLGAQVPESVVARLVWQADGNALFLEELIRSAAEGHGEGPPSSVLAMLQSRLLRLEPQARRMMLAASIFGRTFWAGGCQALLEPSVSSQELAHGLRRLVELELVQRQPGSRFPAEAEYRFHHALLRDAAYSLLPDSLRATGHLQAGEWLESAGESEPIVLAEHYKLGGQKHKAIHFFTLACKQNCERQRTDLHGAQRCLKAALECGPTGQALTDLQILEVNIAFWRDDFAHTLAVSEELLPKLAEGSAPWMQVVGSLIAMNSMQGRLQAAAALGQRLLDIDPAPEAVIPYSEALAFLSGMYQWTGQQSAALTLVERQGQVARRGEARNSFAHGWWCVGRGYFEFDFGSRLWRCRELAEEGIKSFTQAGADSNRMIPHALLGQSLAALGELSKAVEVLTEELTKAKYFGRFGTWLQMHTALVLSASPEPRHQEEACRLAHHERQAEQTNPQYLGIAIVSLARVALAQGSLAQAETWTREACELLSGLPIYQMIARICSSAVLRSQGRIQESRAEAEYAVRLLEGIGGSGLMSLSAWLSLAEACQAQGDDAAAEGALRQALECLRLRGRDLPDAATRQRFLSQVPENARVLQLAFQRWGKSIEDGLIP